MSIPLNQEAEIIKSLMNKNQIIENEIAISKQSFEMMELDRRSVISENEKIIQSLTPLAEWVEE